MTDMNTQDGWTVYMSRQDKQRQLREHKQEMQRREQQRRREQIQRHLSMLPIVYELTSDDYTTIKKYEHSYKIDLCECCNDNIISIILKKNYRCTGCCCCR